MNAHKFWLKAAAFSSVLTLNLVNLCSHIYVSQAQTPTLATTVRYSAPQEVPQGPGEPRGRARGGGSRGLCKQYETLTALVPVTKTPTKEVVWGQTTSQNPTFWFNVPEKLTNKVAVEFALLDEADNYIYKTKLTPPETPSGIISIFVPPTAKALEVGKSYRWTFSIYCDPEKPSASVYVRGSIQRVDLNAALQKQLVTAKTPLERAAIFANNGIWYDAITTLGDYYQRHGVKDGAIASAWTNLLKQVNLGDAASAAIVPCCTLQTAK